MQPEPREMVKEQPGHGSLGVNPTVINEHVAWPGINGLDVVASLAKNFANQSWRTLHGSLEKLTN